MSKRIVVADGVREGCKVSSGVALSIVHHKGVWIVFGCVHILTWPFARQRSFPVLKSYDFKVMVSFQAIQIVKCILVVDPGTLQG